MRSSLTFPASCALVVISNPFAAAESRAIELAMADEKTNTRIVLSRRTLALYEAEGLPAGPVEQVMAMLGDEVAVLRGIVSANPEKALSVGGLIRRWTDLAELARAKAH